MHARRLTGLFATAAVVAGLVAPTAATAADVRSEQRQGLGNRSLAAALTAHGSAHVNGPGVLRAYDANDVTHELWDSAMSPAADACGRISKNAPPTVVNGKVYLASFGTLPVGTGALYVYGLLPAK